MRESINLGIHCDAAHARIYLIKVGSFVDEVGEVEVEERVGVRNRGEHCARVRKIRQRGEAVGCGFVQVMNRGRRVNLQRTFFWFCVCFVFVFSASDGVVV